MALSIEDKVYFLSGQGCLTLMINGENASASFHIGFDPIEIRWAEANSSYPNEIRQKLKGQLTLKPKSNHSGISTKKSCENYNL